MQVEPWHLLRRAVLSNVVSPGPYLFWGTIHGPLVLEGAQRFGWGVAVRSSSTSKLRVLA
jgi:threonine/homoserine/homoserine lactone efflux protein